MNFKVIRRGFTVVEIVIVIAVIAVLAGVMVPTISNIVKKAQQSVDEQLVNNLNKILMAEEVIEGKNPYMHAAVLDLAENGYDLDSLKMSDEDNILVWEENIDRFIIMQRNENNVVNLTYCSKADEEHFELVILRHNCWAIFTSADYENGVLNTRQNLSIYWGEDSLPNLGNNGIFDDGGLDLGYCEDFLDFEGKGTSDNPDWLVFNKYNSIVRGNFTMIQINSAGLKHYGKIKTEIKLFFSESSAYWIGRDYDFHEYGYVEKVYVHSENENREKTLLGQCKFVAEQGAKFKQSLDEIKGIVGGESHFKNNGAEFGVSF